MCGITGFLDPQGKFTNEDAGVIVGKMSDVMGHRGPDDDGVWVHPSGGVAFGHRRLSILDLSQHGHQPMMSHNKDWVMVYNGEVYNFAELRTELERLGHHFHGHCDTEVILAAFVQWGVEVTVKRFVGMFALAALHISSRRLYLVRDRLGIKPLYYGWSGQCFLFASELKSMTVHPHWVGDISPDSSALFLRHSYIPAPFSVYKNIFKLLPGTLACISLDNLSPGRPVTPQSFWNIQELMEQETLEVTDEAAVLDTLEQKLSEAIAGRMIADVPLGAFLSGGIDSSLVVALMQAQASRPVKTFTIGFQEEGFNEAEHAKAVAAHLGTEHHELYVTSEDAREVIPKLPFFFDEPFADASAVPTFLVSRMARQHVTVSLSGDGGDELFFGYSRYLRAMSYWSKRQKLPQPLRLALGGLLGLVPGVHSGSERMSRASRLLRESNPEGFYRNLVSTSLNGVRLVPGSHDLETVFTARDRFLNKPSLSDKMMYLDLCTYLPDDILVKVDRASMGVSLEARVPLLDHRVVEFATRLPMNLKYRDGQSKWALREILYRHVPKALIDRPKQGFALPFNLWLRDSLRPWAEDLLSLEQLNRTGQFDQKLVRTLWEDFLAGGERNSTLIWQLLMYQAWHHSLSEVRELEPVV